MAHITLHNESDVNVNAVLIWGLSEIDKTHISKGEKGQLNCASVWYDLYVYQDIEGGKELAAKKTIYCDTAWVIKKTSGGAYVIEQD